MAYDFVRIGIGVFAFIILLLILIPRGKKKSKSVLISAFTAIILYSVLMLFPFENLFYQFPSVEKIYAYRHHEKLLTYAEGESLVLAVGEKSDGSPVYYSFLKNSEGYKLTQRDSLSYRSSTFGIYTIASYGDETVIVTTVSDSEYGGKKFEEIGAGYSSVTVNGTPNLSSLTCKGERVKLV